MFPVMRVGSETLMIGPHWFMLLCTFAIVIGLSVVIYGVVLDDRADVRNPLLQILQLWVLATPHVSSSYAIHDFERRPKE